MWLAGVQTLVLLLAALSATAEGSLSAVRHNVETVKLIAANALKMVNIPKYVSGAFDPEFYAETLPL